MATITAAEVKKLRDATGAGMMDAKKALTEADGDFDGAVEILRVTGQAKMAKRSDREASNGLVAAAGKTVIQLGAETDFVAKNAEFMALADEIAAAVDAAGAHGVEAAGAVALPSGQTVADAVAGLSAKIGEKLELAAAATFAGGQHLPAQAVAGLPPQVGVMVEYDGGDERSSWHREIAAMSPAYVTATGASRCSTTSARSPSSPPREGKPEQIIPRIVDGRLGGFTEVCLVEQASVSDDKLTVGQLLKKNGVEVKRFVASCRA